MGRLTWACEGHGPATIEIDDAWLGPFSAHEHSMPPGARTIALDAPEFAWSNLAALALLPWWKPQELLVADGRSLTPLGRLGTDGSFDLPVARSAELARVWERLCADLPTLPWHEIRVFAGNWRWPRALSLPGAVLLSDELPPGVAASLLYLVHELLHQWIGGVSAPPVSPAAHARMEAAVDACAWHVVSSVLPATHVAFARLYERSARSPALRDHARQVVARHHELDGDGWARLVETLATATQELQAGTRTVFTAAGSDPQETGGA